MDLYESDSLFDKFDVCVSGDGRHIGTGTYSNLFRVCDRRDAAGTTLLEASRDPTRRRVAPAAPPLRASRRPAPPPAPRTRSEAQ